MEEKDLINRIKNYILEHGLLPGDKLPGEIAFCKMFHVSRSSVREALKYFTQIGIMERVKKKGTVLRTPNVDDIGKSLAFQLKMLDCPLEEIKAARLLLETSLVDDIVMNMSDKSIRQLEEANAKLAGLEGEPYKADLADQEFHMIMSQNCGNRLYQAFSQVITLIFDARYRDRFHSLENIRRSVRYHNAMIQAIKETDSAKLKKLLEQHIRPL